MKLALFFNASSNKSYVGDELTEKYCTDLARTSEWVEVEFPPLSDENRQAQLNRLEEARQAARKYCDEQIRRIDKHAEALGCTCLCPFDKAPGRHHSLACPRHTEVAR